MELSLHMKTGGAIAKGRQQPEDELVSCEIFGLLIYAGAFPFKEVPVVD